MAESRHDVLGGTLDLYRRSSHVPGWIDPLDAVVFAVVSAIQNETCISGDILEIGAYEGRSAILLGALCQRGERLIVSDLFGGEAPTALNAAENEAQYRGLSRYKFEQNYRRFHSEAPVVVEGASKTLADQLVEPCCRIIHVDGGHRYTEVAGDVALSRVILRSGGVVAFDDIRTEYAPGVAAAVWPALQQGLVPLLMTRQKLFATWDSTSYGLGEELANRLNAVTGVSVSHIDDIANHRVFHAVGGNRFARLRRKRGLKAAAQDYVPPAFYRAASRIRRRFSQ